MHNSQKQSKKAPFPQLTHCPERAISPTGAIRPSLVCSQLHNNQIFLSSQVLRSSDSSPSYLAGALGRSAFSCLCLSRLNQSQSQRTSPIEQPASKQDSSHLISSYSMEPIASPSHLLLPHPGYVCFMFQLCRDHPSPKQQGGRDLHLVIPLGAVLFPHLSLSHGPSILPRNRIGQRIPHSNGRLISSR